MEQAGGAAGRSCIGRTAKLAVAAVVLLLAGCASGGVHEVGRRTVPASTASTVGRGAATTTTAPPGTSVRYAAPVDIEGHPTSGLTVSAEVSGGCESGSDSVQSVDVYRCMSGNRIYDPCWSDAAGGLLCMESPWSTSVVHLSDPVGVPFGTSVATTNLDWPWGVQLTDGSRCIADQGAHDEFRGKVIDFSCSGGTVGGLSLERGVDRSGPKWTYSSAVLSGGQYTPGPTVSVAIAWFAGPAPEHAPACQGSDIVVSSEAQSGGGGVGLLFTNRGLAACSLVGYPGVAVLDGSGHQVFQVARAPGVPPVPPPSMLVPAGGAVDAGLDGSPGTNTDQCPMYDHLLVTPPNTTTTTTLAIAAIGICSTATISTVGFTGGVYGWGQ